MKTKRSEALGAGCILLVSFFVSPGCDTTKPAPTPCPAEINQTLRDDVIRYLRNPQEPAARQELSYSGGWQADVKLYSQGKLLGEGKGKGEVLADALHAASVALQTKIAATQPSQTMQQGRYFVTLLRNGKPAFLIVEYDGKGLEVVGGDLVAVREVDTNLLRKQIEAGRDYLLRMMNPKMHAFFKRFDATTGVHDTRLRTIYTASSLYTLLKMYDLTQDAVIEKQIPQIAGFLLSMQCTEGENRGAFHYSVHAGTGEKEKRFVVGTASKTIFTLLELYRRTKEPKYLHAAKDAGDWLLTMQKADGTMVNSVHCKDGQWVRNEKFSTLYIGQVISALSRLYGATRDKRYLHGAEISTGVLLARAQKMKYFLRDDFRRPDDPVPTTWVVQSLLDFYKVTKNPAVKNACLRCAKVVLAKQHVESADIAHFGRFEGTHATSGNGWILEVFMELYRCARSQGWDDCEPFKTAAVRVSRWLIQNTYSPANTYFLPQGRQAIGGLIRSYREESVRTDAVCHGSNGYILLLDRSSPGVLLSVPETSPLVSEMRSE